MKYKTGDKVRLRSDLVINRIYGGYYYSYPMWEAHKPGSVVTIKEVNLDRSYFVQGSPRPFWTDEMFAGLAEEDPPETPPEPDYCWELEHLF